MERQIKIGYRTGEEREALIRVLATEGYQEKGNRQIGEIGLDLQIQEVGKILRKSKLPVRLINLRKQRGIGVDYESYEITEEKLREILSKEYGVELRKGRLLRWFYDIDKGFEPVIVSEEVPEGERLGIDGFELQRRMANKPKEKKERKIKNVSKAIKGLEEEEIRLESEIEGLEAEIREIEEQNERYLQKRGIVGEIKKIKILLSYKTDIDRRGIEEKLGRVYTGYKITTREYEGSKKVECIEIGPQLEVYKVNEIKENKERKKDKYILEKEIEVEGKTAEEIVVDIMGYIDELEMGMEKLDLGIDRNITREPENKLTREYRVLKQEKIGLEEILERVKGSKERAKRRLEREEEEYSTM